MRKKQKEKNIIEVTEEVEIGDYVLEAGDKIKIMKEAVRQEDLIKSIKRAFRNSLEVEEIEYEGESAFERGYHFEGDRGSNGESEWVVFTSEEDAENEAYEMVEQDIDMEPEIFNKDFLMNHVYISDTDKRLIAVDEADAMVDGLDEDEVFERLDDSGLQGDYEDAVENEDYSKADEVLEDARDKLRDQIVDDMKERLEDPLDYFTNDIGYSFNEFMKLPFVQINTREAAEEAVNIDGPSHFLDPYDGKVEEIEDPQTGDTFYAYGTN